MKTLSLPLFSSSDGDGAESAAEEAINVSHWAREWLTDQGVNDFWLATFTLLIDLGVLAVISLVADFIARRVLLAIAHRIVKRTKATWDDYFFEQRVFKNLAHLVPALIILLSIPVIFKDLPDWIGPLQKVVKIYIGILGAIVVQKITKALLHFTESNELFKGKPIKTILQVVQVMNIFIAVIFVIAMLTGTNIAALLGALAGTTAILILIFQDAINGLLANFQITMYDLVEKGDWITFEKFGVDGDVISIDLTTVKVRNWDNTISSIPAIAFVSESFVNWRGMKNANMRRIKRNILIDINSIRLCDENMLSTYKKIAMVSSYVDKKQKEIDKYNEENNFDKGAASINGRHQTNIGIYRAYIKSYLESHPKIAKKDAMVMVRQLQPTAQGIPLEVYCFSADIVWENYESIQSDIFDHLYAATAFFDLRLFQNVSGFDVHQGLNPPGEA